MILDKLLSLQVKLNETLISEEEIEYINNLLKTDGKTEIENGLYEWELTLKNEKRITMIADYNPVLSSRRKFGNISLKSAQVLSSKIISGEQFKGYNSITRVFSYYN